MNLDFEENSNGFLISLRVSVQKISTEILNVSDQLTINQRKILSAIISNNKITYSELAKRIDIAPTNIARKSS